MLCGKPGGTALGTYNTPPTSIHKGFIYESSIALVFALEITAAARLGRSCKSCKEPSDSTEGEFPSFPFPPGQA
jgi:hypothetical protein